MRLEGGVYRVLIGKLAGMSPTSRWLIQDFRDGYGVYQDWGRLAKPDFSRSDCTASSCQV
jgi:hypothetical protein